MGGATLPPGFRFHPTDVELVGYYLKRKVDKLEIELEVIPEIEFYKFDPWELPEKSFLPKRDMEWFFFCPRDRKYPNGSRTNRATKAGYWKATGKDRKVVCETVTGFRKTLVFYQGRAPLGNRTDWVMHEYRLSDDTQNVHGAFALCRVIKRNGFNEGVKAKKVGSNSGNKDLVPSEVSNEPLSISSDYQYNSSTYSSPISSPYITPRAEFETTASITTNSSNLWVSPELILDSSKEYSRGKETSYDFYSRSEFDDSVAQWQPCQQQQQQQGISPSTSYSNFGEIEHFDNLNQIGCLSPYSANIDYMGFYENSKLQYFL
ncbi:hypothetical protein RND81_06G220000 [Saponaria officinalis]|uniref:NAC domain-containing protein n=1 Tax=Saponaria officinalis TaxID=3572 RepID=A0AAW1KEK9_SAPOF